MHSWPFKTHVPHRRLVVVHDLWVTVSVFPSNSIRITIEVTVENMLHGSLEIANKQMRSWLFKTHVPHQRPVEVYNLLVRVFVFSIQFYRDKS